MCAVWKTQFRAMGTHVDIAISLGQLYISSVKECVVQIKSEIHRLESLLSRFRADSEISSINLTAPQWHTVSSETLEVLLLAQQAYVDSRGIFNPFVGGVLESLGYDVTFEDIPKRQISVAQLYAPFIPTATSPLEIDSYDRRVRVREGYKVDLGGIAKGWIVEQAAGMLERFGVRNFLLSAGGDVVCRGDNGGEAWVVDVIDPFHTDKSVMSLNVRNMCLATSGTYRRKWITNEKHVHHIIDPFLGDAAITDIVSCTVVTPSLVQAEVAAKVVLILGFDGGLKWLSKSSNGYVIVKTSGEVVSNATH